MTIWTVPELAIAVRTLIALVFLTAAVGKLRNLAVFEGVVANYRLLPDALVALVAKALPVVELLLGLALLLGIASPWPEVIAAALLLGFAAAMAINIRRGRTNIDCGCFQSALKQTLSWTLVGRNLGLTLVLVIPALSAAGALSAWVAIEGVLAGAVLFLLLQSLNILWSVVPHWLQPKAHSHSHDA